MVFIILLSIVFVINLPITDYIKERISLLNLINHPYVIFVTILIGLLNFYFISQERSLSEKNKNETKKWPYNIAVFLVIILSGVFYFNGIGNYGFQGDEYYHAQITKNFFEGKKLFEIEDGVFYNRSEITSLLPIASKYVFTTLNINASDEFIYRFPIVIISLLSVLLIYFISKEFTSKKLSILIALAFSMDSWFVYFAKFLRFYSPTLFFQLLLLFLLIKIKNKWIKYLILLISAILFLFLQTYFILLIGFISLIIIIEKFKEKKYLQLSIIALGGITFLLFQIFLMIKNSETVGYNEVALSLNIENIGRQLSWLIKNYSIFFITFISSLPIFFRNKIYNYTLLSFVFFVFYINNTGFNFTFRPIYFFLPLMIIFSVLSMQYFIKNKKSYYSILIILITLNIFYSLKYPANTNESCFYPTKLIYEKSSCISSEKILADFVFNYSDKNNFNVDNIYFLGMGNLKYYFNIRKDNILNYTNENGKFNNLKDILTDKEGGKIIFIADLSSFPVENKLQQLFFNRDYASEISTSISKYLEEDNNSEVIFETEKKQSKVFLINN